MDVDRFTRERAEAWEDLAGLVREAGTRPQRLGAERLLRLGRRYRSATADLALARRLFPADPVTRKLERLVTDARQCVYASEARRRSVIDFVTTGYWQRIRERPVALFAGIAMLLVPLALAAFWAIDDPAAALGVVPTQFQDAADPSSGGSFLSPGEEAALSSAIYTNNIRVTFIAIAGGIFLGLGSAAITIFNGGFVGALVGLTIENGRIGDLLQFVLPHGVLELSCIAVACSAGLRLGWSLINPGHLTRGASLRQEARPAMEIVLGTMPWLVVAGLTEGFVSPRHPSLPVATIVGLFLAVTFWTLVIVRGRVGGDPSHARPLALARR